MVRFLEKAIKNEVAATTMQTTLFRSNNFTVVMLAAHSRVIAIVRCLQFFIMLHLLDLFLSNISKRCYRRSSSGSWPRTPTTNSILSRSLSPSPSPSPTLFLVSYLRLDHASSW